MTNPPISNPMSGKTVAVTGATSGIGLEVARAVAKMGSDVILIARNPAKGEVVRQEILATNSSSMNSRNVELVIADLTDYDQIRQATATINANFPHLDVLINNAGIFLMKRQPTVQGQETTIAANHLGHFLLTLRLLDQLHETAEAHGEARIINVSSGAHMGARNGINFNDLHGARSYSGWKAYSQAKLANVLFTYALAERLEGTGITANALHPGFVRTNFGQNNMPGVFKPVMKLFAMFGKSPAEGAQTAIYLATSPHVKGVSGKYFVNSKAVASSPISQEKLQRDRLWNLSKQEVGFQSGDIPMALGTSQQV